jgi:predicted PurR-regulated permease PerM
MDNSETESKDELLMKKYIELFVHMALIFLLIIWCFKIVSPFITPIVWGIVIAIGTYPTFKYFIRKTGLSNGIGATVYTLIMLILLITPSVMLTSVLLGDAQNLSQNLADGNLNIPEPPEMVAEIPLVGEKLDNFWTNLSKNPKETLGEFQTQVNAAAKFLLKAAAGAGLSLLMFIFSIIIAGIFIAKADACNKAALILFKRVAGAHGENMTRLSHQTIQSVIRGILGIAIIQTLLAGLGFIAMGIPGAGFLAVICLVLAVIQIDILIILIPLSIYAFSFAGTGAAVTFLIWNLFVGILNNVLKPILLGRGVDSPMLVIFLGAIGGMLLSGILGLFIGPVVLALGYALFIDWLDYESNTTEKV